MHDDIAATVKDDLHLKTTAPFILDNFASQNSLLAANFGCPFATAREADWDI